MARPLVVLLLLGFCLCVNVSGWVAPSPQYSVAQQRLLGGRRYGFLKGLIDQAFENDESITQDEKRTGQIDAALDEDISPSGRRARLTKTQESWRKKTSQAVVDLAAKSFDLDFYLTGVPNKDPSNDLFGARTNISSRDRKLGQTVPEEPTISNIRVNFFENNKCVCETQSSFTVGETEGDWKLSEDGRQVRFRVQVTGFTRTIQTRGTIQSVFWSDEPDQQTSASTIYSIPEGWLYGEAEVTSTRPGTVTWKNGLLKIEQRVGVLGAGSKMSPCGRFEARAVVGSPVVTK